MVWILVLVGSAAILFIWFWRWGSQPTPIQFTQPGAIRQALRWVVLRGVYKADLRGLLEVFFGGRKKAGLIFTKKKYDNGEFGVVATVDPAGLPAESPQTLDAALTGKGIQFTRVPSGEQISVEVRKDFGLALVLLQTVCLDAARLKLETDCVGYLRNVVLKNAPSLTGVDAPDEEVWFR